MYGSRDATTYEDTVKNTNNSTIKTYIDNWYKTNIMDTGYSKFVSNDAIFCNDRQVSRSYKADTTYTQLGYGKEHTLYEAYSKRWERYHNANTSTDKENLYEDITLICKQNNDKFSPLSATLGNKTLTYPVGLITMDEIILAGAGTKQEKGDTQIKDDEGNVTSTIYGYRRANRNFYLYTNQAFWSLTPDGLYYDGTARIFLLNSVGNAIGWAYTDGYQGVRPVINLNSDVTITSGVGTKDSPYVVQTE